MGLFSRFESKAEDVIEGGGRGGLEPVKIAKRAGKEMQREKMVGVGAEYAPTLYNVLVSAEDDHKMSGYYPSLAGEIETYLSGQASRNSLSLDCPPLVRFIVDEGLKRGRFDVIAENVSPSIIEELRREEEERYGILRKPERPKVERPARSSANTFDPFVPSDMQSASYVPEDAPANPEPIPEPTPAYIPAEVPAPEPAPVPEPEPEPEPEPSVQEEVTTFIPPASAAETVLLSGGEPAGPLARLVEVDTGFSYDINAERSTIGRGSNCDVCIIDPGISRHHAELLLDGSAWVIRDTGSTNGTSVNDLQVNQSQIYDGDIIEMGNTRLEFQEG